MFYVSFAARVTRSLTRLVPVLVAFSFREQATLGAKLSFVSFVATVACYLTPLAPVLVEFSFREQATLGAKLTKIALWQELILVL